MQQLESIAENALALCVRLEKDGDPEVLDACRMGREVAAVLASWGADDILYATALLHKALWINAITVDEIAATCHPQIAQLCETFAWLSVPGGEQDPLPIAGEVAAADEVAALEVDPAGQAALLAMPVHWQGHRLTYRRIRAYCIAYHDPDLALLQAAVLWHRFQQALSGNLDFQAYLDEAAMLLGPYLEMLGMRQVRGLLATRLSGRQRTESNTGSPGGESRALLESVQEHLAHLLADATFNTQNTQTHKYDAPNTAYVARAKTHAPTIEILVDDEASCYQALYIAHRLFLPVENSLSDNIGASRVNGYRGLSSAVMVPAALPDMPIETEARSIKAASRTDLRRQRVDLRIATRAMDAVNRWGLAALNKMPGGDDDLPGGWWQQAEAGFQQILSAPLGSLPDMLYVFSPHGQLFKFSRGCTVIDYAYNVHSDLADRCSKFVINGLSAEPGTILHHLDLVELEHDPLSPGPTQAWLEAAQTNRARSQIEKHLKRMGQGAYQGQRVVAQRLRALEEHFGFGMPEHRVNQAVTNSIRRMKLSRIEDLYAEISAGRWSADRMLYSYFADEVKRQVRVPRELRLRAHQLQMAQCCMPRPGEDIVGRPLRRRGVLTGLKVHRVDCTKSNESNAAVSETFALSWRLQPQVRTLVRVEMMALNDDGLLGDAISTIYEHLPEVQLHRVEAQARQGIASLRFTLETESADLVESIVADLRTLPSRNVDSVHAMSLPPSEEDEVLSHQSVGAINPYSRLPVHEREMFFGRAHDLTRVVEWLQGGVGSVWLRGQKRVGKTSLLLHMQRFQLEEHGCLPVFVDFQLLSGVNSHSIFFEIASTVYNELVQETGRNDLRHGELGAPLRELFDHDPQGQFIAYLRNVQSKLGTRRLVLLMDEFSRTIDAFHQERLDDSFFHQWRGVMLATMPAISYVTVVQQKSYDMLTVQRAQSDIDPIWELLELGEQLALRQLDRDDVRRLIEWPIRNYLEYTPETIDIVARLTGGSPFFIQAFCFKLVSHMTRLDRRQVMWEDVEVVLGEFMEPNESLFSHLLDLVHGIGHTVIQGLALLCGDNLDSIIPTEELASALPDIDQELIHSTLMELAAQDILVYTGAGEEIGWSFANLLFQQWLLTNAFIH